MFCVFAFAFAFGLSFKLFLFAIRSPFDILLLRVTIFCFHCRFAMSIHGLADNLLNHLKLTYMTLTISLTPLLLPLHRCYCTKFFCTQTEGQNVEIVVFFGCCDSLLLEIVFIYCSFHSPHCSFSHFLPHLIKSIRLCVVHHAYIKWHSMS